MRNKIKIGAVSYLNTKPLIYGLEHLAIANEIELRVDYPALLPSQLTNGAIDIALLPVAAIPGIEGARIITDYGIAAEGNVASVALFSDVPVEKIKYVYLDYQSRTSIKLAQFLLRHHWRQDVEFLQATENYIEKIEGETAGVIIGDRALQSLDRFEYIYDLSKAWKDYTSLDFVFAAWVTTKDLPVDFVALFNEANAFGLHNLDKIIEANPCPFYDLKTYYTENIKFYLDAKKRQGLSKFHEMMGEL